ncbi:hypothetical protein [Tenacibaculum finnmarkense]|uniref:hypothetical protein n=1 Tax=Tenacibaculum finnmarkense TaxID=2781243 RepID=UPI000C3EC5A9|nr:hypothetical protein [Tenacibaculum finnmarkense]MCD8440960.1 hypothetical protein [Tenacibaculum finnmarkense genomovar ulcerans]MCG8721877.1 hypothetical protein [Tenacibaculum finnmarkense]SOS55897.1 conserved hypothetical protein [Tenacibaculum finnmarkense]
MNCLKCNKKLNFFNKPAFGLGKLKDGNELCHSCFRDFTKVDINLTRKFKKYTLNEIENLLLQKTEKVDSIEIEFDVTTSLSSDQPDNEKVEYEKYIKKYPKWFSENNTIGLCYKSSYFPPLTNQVEEIVNYKTDKYADLFGRGKDCSYFPGYGKIQNRTFEIWYQEFGSKEKKNIIEYKDIGAIYQAPFFTEEMTEGWLINNELERKQDFLKLYNIRVVKTRKTWYAGLKSQEFTGLITEKEIE